MKVRNIIMASLLIVLSLALISGTASALGSTPVTVQNSTSNPVPVTPIATTTVKFQATSQTELTFQIIDVSLCRTLRFNVNNFGGSGTIGVSLIDEVSEVGLLSVEVADGAQLSQEFETPGTSLQVVVLPFTVATYNVALFCRP